MSSMHFPGCLVDLVLTEFYDLPMCVPFEGPLLDASALKESGVTRDTPSYIRLYGRERRALQRLVRAHKSSQRDVLRAKIVLLAARGEANSKIASSLGCDVQTVRKWRERFVLYRHAGLCDSKRTGRPRTFSAEVRHQLFALAVSDPPEPYARWTVDLLCQAMCESKFRA